MGRAYNPLNKVKIDLARAGICADCGRRMTDPECIHATKEQREYTAQLDAKWDEEEAAKKADRNRYDQVLNGKIKMTDEYRAQIHAEYNARFTH